MSSSAENQAPPLGSFSYLIPLYIAWRVWWANRMPLMDCDEVYNYWEPLHFMLFENGLQTWEYANQYALRTYAYLAPLYAVSKVLLPVIPSLPPSIWPLLQQVSGVTSPKVGLFLLLRALLAGSMAVAELSFVQALAKVPSGRVVSLVTAFLLLTCTGMSHASGALLPSTTLTLLWLLGAAAYLQEQHVKFSILAVTATLAIGWPFGCLLFVPLGMHVLMREFQKGNIAKFILSIICITAVIQSVVMAIDYFQYGRLVSPTWNILMYNTKAGGDELYGIEATSYYVKNLLLNFNLVALGVLALPLAFWGPRRHFLVLLLPMYMWLLVVVPRPHKEERFLFPIYPLLCVGAAILSGTVVEGTANLLRKSTLSPKTSLIIQLVLWIPAAVLSLSRTVALSKYYTAPLTIYAQLANHAAVGTINATICTCGEWYRFPSSFYLPNNLRFVRSSFEGQLPAPFAKQGSRPNENPKYMFNDQNRLESDRFTDIEDCDFLVDLFDSNCRENEGLWYPMAHAPFLDAERTDTLHRTLYLPHLHEDALLHGGVEYVDYILYKYQEIPDQEMPEGEA
jgi:alpha-1,2-mannosyltransferase